MIGRLVRCRYDVWRFAERKRDEKHIKMIFLFISTNIIAKFNTRVTYLSTRVIIKINSKWVKPQVQKLNKIVLPYLF